MTCELCKRTTSGCVCWTPSGQKCDCMKCLACNKCLVMPKQEVTCSERCNCVKDNAWVADTIAPAVGKDIANIICKFTIPIKANRRLFNADFDGDDDIEEMEDDFKPYEPYEPYDPVDDDYEAPFHRWET